MDLAQLQTRAVVSVQQAEKLGEIADVLIDITNHRIAGLVLRGGLFRGGPTVPWKEVRTIGQDAVMVDESSAAGDNEIAGAVSLSAFKGRKVVTHTGDLAGTIDGLDFDPDDGAITHYRVAVPSTGLFRSASHIQIPPSAIAAVGDALITVDAAALESPKDS